jgi:L-threonylcarbamoyladenylate synthase
MGTDDAIRRAVAAIRNGEPVLLPTDTVYGLVTSADREEYGARLYRLKGRAGTQPTALLAASIDRLVECLPELTGRAAVIARELLPGPYTLILPNPALRFPWLTGGRADAIGVRVPELPEPAARVLEGVAACVLATSANEPGGPSPATLDEVPSRLREACAAEIDAGRLAGTPSTVIDFTGADPIVIRDGAGLAAEGLARVRKALAA